MRILLLLAGGVVFSCVAGAQGINVCYPGEAIGLDLSALVGKKTSACDLVVSDWRDRPVLRRPYVATDGRVSLSAGDVGTFGAFRVEVVERGTTNSPLAKTWFARLRSRKVEPVDAGVLVHAIPGGMISNLRSQLAQQDALDRLPEVLEELPKTRADMGYPPLVTPTSQIVGVQSVLNVLSGKRYSMVTDETKRYAAGYYGRTPAKIDPKLQKKLCGGLKPITCRPADLLKPGLVAAADELPPNTIQAEEDILSYALFPEVALGYFKWRNADPKDREPIPADVEEAKRVAGEATAAAAAIMVEGNSKPAAKVNGTPVLAPLNGTFYRSDAPGKPKMAEDGAAVKAGQSVCVVEAMKLFNPIKASAAGKITFLVEHGKAVTKGQVIAAIA